MLIYDKVILDTSNFFYRVAALYLKDLNQENLTQLIKNNTVFTHYRNILDNLLTQTVGEICVLFDPMIVGHGESERLKIKEGYKSTRDKNSPVVQLRLDTLEKLYSDLIINPKNRINLYHDVSLEADDFVEKLTETGKCLMITSDEDFARYLETGRVEMLTSGLQIVPDNIYTADDFETKHGFKPNIASVTFWKAFYGDVSDNIVGSFQNKCTKVIRTASDEMMQIIKELGQGSIELPEAKSLFFSGSGRFEKLRELLKLSNTERSYEKLLDLTDENFRVIESKLPRSSEIPVDKFKVNLEFNVNKKAKKFTLNQGKL